MKTRKNILISHIGIPSDMIGGWNFLFTNLIKRDSSVFTHIISPKTIKKVQNINHLTLKEPTFAVHKTVRLINHYKKNFYWKA